MTKTAHDELFELTMLDQAEDAVELMHYWKLGAQDLGLTEEDISFAVHNWMPRHLDLQYKGVRMCVGATLRELIDIFRFKDRKRKGEDVKGIYGVLPAVLAPYQSIKYAGGDKVYTSFPDLLLMFTLQAWFHKGAPLMEKAEAAGFSYGARHCALNKIGIAGRMTGLIPAPDVMWSWGLVCDEATKVDEFLQTMTDDKWISVITRMPHDTYKGDEDYQLEDRIKYLGSNLRDSMAECEKALGIKVSEEDMRRAADDFGRFMGKIGQLTMLNAAADPVPLRNSTLTIPFGLASIPFNTGVGYMEEAIDILMEEVKEAAAKGEGLTRKGAAKVGAYFNPWATPWLERILIENDCVFIFSMPTAVSKAQSVPLKSTDPHEQFAEQWLQINFGMGCGCDIRNWVEKIEMLKPDAMILGFLDYDRWLGQAQKRNAVEVEEITGVPCYYMEADFYDDRDYSEEALRTRLESLAQIINMKKAERA